MQPHKVDTHADTDGSKTAHYRISTKAEALALIKKASRYYVYANIAGYLHSTDDQYKPGYYRACVEMTKASAERFAESALEFGATGQDEYMQARLYSYTLPGRWNRKTDKAGKPRRRVTLYLG